MLNSIVALLGIKGRGQAWLSLVINIKSHDVKS